MKMTKQRTMLLSLLKESKKPLSAENIYEKLPKGAMNLSTVYRTLDAFFEHGLITKSYLNQKAYYYLVLKDHHHYLICINCQKMIEMDCHIDQFATDLAEKHHFKITHHDMTVYGYCEKCIPSTQ